MILALVAEKSRHGYEVIKALGERVGGDYSPSPAWSIPRWRCSKTGARKRQRRRGEAQALCDHRRESEKYLDENRAQVDAILSRLQGDKRSRLG